MKENGTKEAQNVVMTLERPKLSKAAVQVPQTGALAIEFVTLDFPSIIIKNLGLRQFRFYRTGTHDVRVLQKELVKIWCQVILTNNVRRTNVDEDGVDVGIVVLFDWV